MSEILVIWSDTPGDEFLWDVHRWIDGDNEAVEPIQTFTVAEASQAIHGSSSHATITLAVGEGSSLYTCSDAPCPPTERAAPLEVTIFGANGHEGPTLLAGDFHAGTTETIQVPVGNLGDFQAIELYNRGIDNRNGLDVASNMMIERMELDMNGQHYVWDHLDPTNSDTLRAITRTAQQVTPTGR